MDPQARPVVVIGAHCSGKSLLQWSLAQHPAFTALLDSGWMWSLAKELRNVYEAQVSRSGVSQLVAMGITPDRFVGAFGDAANRIVLDPDGAHEAVDPAAHTAALSRAPRRWIDASQDAVFFTGPVTMLFPHARFVHVIRDARESVLARLGLASDRCTEHVAYEAWLSAVRAGLEAELDLGTERVLRIRHKDLFTAPGKVLRKCLAFLGEPYSEACLRPFTSGGRSSRSITPVVPPVDASSAEPPGVRREAEFLSGVLLSARTSFVYPPAAGSRESRV